VGWAVYVLGYIAAAPWGFLAAAAVCGVALFAGGLVLGLAVGDAAARAALGVAVTGVPGGVMRYCYRRRLGRAWERLRRGRFRS
jgi:VIT1/CCC1 family predicted Fe2+/Mn2+ transporter